jgi:hypothetical protein
MEATAQASRPIIDHSLIPYHVRKDIGLSAYQGTQQFMNWLKEDPIREQRANQLLAEFKQRRAARMSGE